MWYNLSCIVALRNPGRELHTLIFLYIKHSLYAEDKRVRNTGLGSPNVVHCFTWQSIQKAKILSCAPK